MKKLLIPVFISLISCKDDPEPQKFTSIVGQWAFNEPGLISGNFEITGTNGAYQATGTFTIKSGSYYSTQTTLIQSSLDPVVLSQIQFKAATGEYIKFENLQIDLSDYKTIYALYFEVHTSTEHFQYPGSSIEISRK